VVVTFNRLNGSGELLRRVGGIAKLVERDRLRRERRGRSEGCTPHHTQRPQHQPHKKRRGKGHREKKKQKTKNKQKAFRPEGRVERLTVTSPAGLKPVPLDRKRIIGAKRVGSTQSLYEALDRDLQKNYGSPFLTFAKNVSCLEKN
jgi:hypothetical protein